MNIKNIRNRIYILASILVVVLITSTFVIIKEVNKIEACTYDYKDKLIRFHVIANSDTEEDQSLKLKVRDKVVEALSEKLKGVTSLEEAEIILNDNIDYVNNIAKDVILNNNYDYEVNTMLSYENFPDKVYGDYVLLPSMEEVSTDKRKYAEAFKIQYDEQDPYRGKMLVQQHGVKYIDQNRPEKPLNRE